MHNSIPVRCYFSTSSFRCLKGTMFWLVYRHAQLIFISSSTDVLPVNHQSFFFIIYYELCRNSPLFTHFRQISLPNFHFIRRHLQFATMSSLLSALLTHFLLCMQRSSVNYTYRTQHSIINKSSYKYLMTHFMFPPCNFNISFITMTGSVTYVTHLCWTPAPCLTYKLFANHLRHPHLLFSHTAIQRLIRACIRTPGSLFCCLVRCDPHH